VCRGSAQVGPHAVGPLHVVALKLYVLQLAVPHELVPEQGSAQNSLPALSVTQQKVPLQSLNAPLQQV
jgi:hypothetical protein